MKRWIAMGVLAGTALLASFHFLGLSHGQASSGKALNVSIARWQHDAEAAVSFTFDDGLQCHRDKAMPLLDAFGFKGTFYVIAGKMREHRGDPAALEPRFHFGEAALSWDEVRELHADGQEIGNHSMTHSFLDRITNPAALDREINSAADIITAHLGEPPLTFAYPYNQYTPLCHTDVMQKHMAVREQWTDYGGPGFTTQKANGLVLQAIRTKSWLVPMIHGIDSGFEPLASEVLHDHLAFIQRHSGQVWVDTYADVARYQKERETATLHMLDSEPDETEFELTAPLDSAIYNVPLTVIVPLPTDIAVENIEARRGDQLLVFVREADRILLQVRPGTAPVTVSWN